MPAGAPGPPEAQDKHNGQGAEEMKRILTVLLMGGTLLRAQPKAVANPATGTSLHYANQDDIRIEIKTKERSEKEKDVLTEETTRPEKPDIESKAINNETHISAGTKETKKISTIEEFHQIIRNDMVEFACKHVGNPYVWGGTSLTDGIDCSGFTQAVLRTYGVNIPRTAAEQAKCGHETTISEMQPGDLLFYSRGNHHIGHVGMYIGDGKIVHAAGKKTGIEISRYDYKTPQKIMSYFPKA
jgi:cell wall-associated NlpC family hydrolase